MEPSPEFEGDGFAALCVSGPAPREAGGPVRRGGPRRAAHGARDPRLRGRRGPRARARSRALADGSGVELLGVRRDALELMRAADAVCLRARPRRCPMSVLEAMALGATRAGHRRRRQRARRCSTGRRASWSSQGTSTRSRRALVALAADPERARGHGRGRAAAPARALQRRGDGRRLPRRARGDRRLSPRADILLVSLGTTLGWRHADRLFLEQLRRVGRAGRGGRRRLRSRRTACGAAIRSNDLVEMHAARRALLTALVAP